MPTTIQLSADRKSRLSHLKVGGMTYDDVLERLLEGVDPEEFRRRAIQWEQDLARAIRSKPANRRIL